jgi:hypothetical protein
MKKVLLGVTAIVVLLGVNLAQAATTTLRSNPFDDVWLIINDLQTQVITLNNYAATHKSLHVVDGTGRDLGQLISANPHANSIGYYSTYDPDMGAVISYRVDGANSQAAESIAVYFSDQNCQGTAYYNGDDGVINCGQFGNLGDMYYTMATCSPVAVAVNSAINRENGECYSISFQLGSGFSLKSRNIGQFTVVPPLRIVEQ